ncbi:hypothetical protein K8374_23315 [Pseudomonas sp. p1(2021b)]|uniref:hypothetical protein n=1 Tax=Pseudomonas sp. p1(2021b) TaxID=2874628 RepID=UPI001CCD58A3|nr:hypothetical protein [Pseudomonas sp. p1(2021b)]UBM25248.1 hypothetical protein K8374_23315 [Pseudomonas sp. p1(2021b)]
MSANIGGRVLMGFFDENHKKIISAFMALKNKAVLLEKCTLRGDYTINKNDLPFIRVRNYYTNLKDVCDLPIVFMINEELSNMAARHYCPDLLLEIHDEKHLTPFVQINGKPARLSDDDFLSSVSDVRKLLSERINGMVSSLMLDFTVSAFSCFENWISKLYSGYAKKLEAEYEESRRAKIVELLARHGEADSEDAKTKCLEKILSVRSGYRSFPDKVNALFKMVDKKAYVRDINHDKEVIDFLGACRNTVHNSGVYRGKPREVTCNGVTYALQTNKAWYNQSYPQAIALLGELTEIYSALIKSLDDWPVEVVSEEDLDVVSMTQFEFGVNLVLRCDGETVFEDYLVNKLGVGRLQARNISRLLKKIKSAGFRDPEDFCVFELLTQDLLQSIDSKSA